MRFNWKQTLDTMKDLSQKLPETVSDVANFKIFLPQTPSLAVCYNFPSRTKTPENTTIAIPPPPAITTFAPPPPPT